MKVKFGDVGESPASKSSKIRALFHPGTTINAHTQTCMYTSKIWSETELAGLAEVQCRNTVRAALGELVDGLPFAGPCASASKENGKRGAPEWKQFEFWKKADFVFNYNAYWRRGSENIVIANNIATACVKRFGVGPKSLQIVEMEDEPNT